jgi:hypothetical protein
MSSEYVDLGPAPTPQFRDLGPAPVKTAAFKDLGPAPPVSASAEQPFYGAEASMTPGDMTKSLLPDVNMRPAPRQVPPEANTETSGFGGYDPSEPVGSGFAQAGYNLARGIASPAGVAQTAALPLLGAGGAVGGLAKGAMAAQGLIGGNEAVGQLGEAIGQRDPQAAVEAGLGLATNAAMVLPAAGMAAKGVAGRAAEAAPGGVRPPPEAQRPAARPDMLPEPPKAAVPPPRVSLAAKVSQPVKNVVEVPPSPARTANQELPPDWRSAFRVGDKVWASPEGETHTSSLLASVKEMTPEQLKAIDAGTHPDGTALGFYNMKTKEWSLDQPKAGTRMTDAEAARSANPDFIKGQEATQAATEGSGLKGLATEQPTVTTEKVFDKGLAARNRVVPFRGGGFHGQNQLMEAAPDSAASVRNAAAAGVEGREGILTARARMEDEIGKGAWSKFKDVATQEQIEGMKAKASEAGTFDPKEFPDHMDPAAYKKAVDSPLYKKAGTIWDEEVGQRMTELHTKNEGRLLQPQHLGPSGRYFPLSGAVEDQGGLYAQRPGFEAPPNPLNRTRTGRGTFDVTDETLGRRVGGAFSANQIADTIGQLEKDGLIKPVTGEASKTFDYNGKTYTAARVGDHVMPKWVADEVGPVLERGTPREPNPLARAITTASTWGGPVSLEKVAHYTNQAGVLISQGPQIGESALARTVGNIPGIKTGNAIAQMVKSIAKEDRPMVREMIRNGEWYPRLTPEGQLQPMSKVDLRGRLSFRKALLRVSNEGLSPNQLYEAVSRFGEYNSKLAPNLLRNIKGSAAGDVSPFVTAGNAMTRNALRSLKMGVGDVGGIRAAATGGIPAALGTWVAVHVGVTGKVPDPRDPDFKLGQVKYGETEDGKSKYINVARIVSPMGNRGLGASGSKAFVETLARGGNVGQAIDSAQADVVNAQVHPYTGPIVKFGTRAVRGVDPSLQFSAGETRFWPAHEPTAPGVQTYKANLRSAVEGVNPAAEKVVTAVQEKMGWPHRPDSGEGLNAAEHALRALGIISVENTEKRRGALEREQTKWANKEN